jgi:leucyl-tRNA synthetase
MTNNNNKGTNTNSPLGAGGMEYHFRDIEKKWQQNWIEEGVYKVPNDTSKPKYYVMDMFPYPSGAGLHVGHPLGYIASDIFARYKRLKGFNVLHPMGYDAFGLPAEQYAIEHGVHPAVSTAKNIATFRSQLDKIGFSYDWSREVNTSNPKYYKWTQWIFLQLFKSWYNRKSNRTESIDALIKIFEKEGNLNHPVPDAKFEIRNAQFEVLNGRFSADQWKAFDEKTKQDILMEYRIAYCGIGEVNWCEALGTVLANDEVVNGVSERGGYPVVKKKLRQWYLRITEYADRLLEGLQRVDFSEAMKEMQGNWIGKSSGAEIDFRIASPQATLLPERGEDEQSGHYFKTADKTNWQTLKEFGRENRKSPTESEDKLWQAIRNNQLDVKVRRQHSIKGYIVDFALLEVNLVIEVDGGYHNKESQKANDLARDTYLNQLGYAVLRFTNEEILNHFDNVINKIKHAVQSQKEILKRKGSIPLLHEEKGSGDEAVLRVYTTRPDTIFGVDFMVLAPEHELVEQITTPEQKKAVEEYIAYVKSRSERERMAEKKISGVFTGAYALNPFDNKKIPVWISEYVLAGYGTGAIMAVPSGDERDHKFAKHFNLPITNILGDAYNGEEANPTKDAVLSNSGFLNGMVMRDAIDVVINKLEELGIGKRKVNYKMRDAAFSRQRYWGEPFPIKWVDGMAYPLDESELPLELPHVESYKPGPEGEGPLANIPEWKHQEVKLDLSETSQVSPDGGDLEGALETNTMPGYAGSSWYFLRYMDPHNQQEFCDRKWSDYWNQVDLYVGGTEHAVGHLLYSRMWTKALYDLNLISFDEPYRKLLNQGMIQGSSRFVYRVRGTNQYVSFGLKEQYETDELHVDVNIVDGVELDIDAFKNWREEYKDAEFILEDGKYICGTMTEKMSKRLYNTVNPNDIVERYGADTFRMYEMFLGPVEMSKPWDTKGIEGVHRFLKKLWRLFFDEQKGAIWTTSVPSPSEKAGGEAPTNGELKVLHRTIKKIEEDTERFSYNTAVSTFMVCVNELTDLKCHKKEILEPLVIILVPYAPHIAEELWHRLGNTSTVLDAPFPKVEEKYLVETTKEYPVSVNGKLRTTINIDLAAEQPQVEEIVLANPVVQKWTEGKQPKRIIYVKGKMVNVVV